MKTRFFLITGLFILTLLASEESHAVPASPRVHEIVQPDGNIVYARQWGDEWLHGWETKKGYTIIKNEKTGFHEYANTNNKGELKPTGIEAYYLPPDSLKPQIRPFDQNAKEAMKQRAKAAVKKAPTTGTFKIPVILVNFNDTQTTNSASEFESLLFGSQPSIATGPGSFKDYYEEVSYGNFTVSSGPSGVSGWYTANQNHNYYGRDAAYEGDDAHPAELVREAVIQAGNAGFDFSQYDNDGDGRVEVVMIVHQGRGQEESGDSTDIWSHRWDLTSAGAGPITVNGVIVDEYIIQPERQSSHMVTVGVFAHEFGHVLGLPDLYDTDYSSGGIGDWGLMGGGAWNSSGYSGYSGDTPSHFEAWSKYFLGWIDPTDVTGTMNSLSIPNVETNSTAYQFREGSPEGGGEYFLAENRQRTGFDQGLPGSGLLIWHIDEDKQTSDNTDNSMECAPNPDAANCTDSHYRVTLVQADNRWDLENNYNSGDGGDPFPGTSNKTSFSGTASPSSKLWNNSGSGITITSINSADNNITANLNYSSLTHRLTSPVTTTVSQGGLLGPFSASTTNSASSSYSYYVYAYIYTPDGTWHLMFSNYLTIPAGTTFTISQIYFVVPSSASTGTHYHQVNLYDTSGNLVDYDNFSFYVSAASSSPKYLNDVEKAQEIMSLPGAEVVEKDGWKMILIHDE